MHTVTRTVIVGSCMFLLGVALGSLRFPGLGVERRHPVRADFCFILRNPDLIGSRHFITTAKIVPVPPHGSVLESDSCPNMGGGFSEQLYRQDFSQELDRRLQDEPYDPVPIEFEGTLYRPSLVRRLWFGTVVIFGLHGDSTPPVTIRAYETVGSLGGQNSLEPPVAGDGVAKPSTSTLVHESGHVLDAPKQR